ncbi:MAG: histidine kinase [Prolixibacteraceae bacterium]|nr:histidine kinase [Prolixibacteraceae bacterium]
MMKFYKATQFLKKVKQEQLVLFFVHLSVWLMLFVAFSMFSLRENESLPTFIVLLYLYGMLLFYLNYFLLTPRLLIPKKYLLFSGTVIIIGIFSWVVIDPLIQKEAMMDFAKNPPPRIEFRPQNQNLPGLVPFNKDFEPRRRPQGMLFTLLTFLTISSSVRIFQKLKREESMNQQYQHEKLNAELKLLRQQVNPHFLFNSLNNIHSLANQKSDLTSEAIMKLSAILRHMLSENPSEGIPVSREIALIGNYIELQKLWMKNAITVDYQVGHISETHCIEPFILNPLVENAFKYGALQGIESVISIHLHMDDDWLYLRIVNPVLREQLSEVTGMGIGLNNVIRRLDLCYPGNHQIEADRKGNSYQVKLSIKLRNNELHSN